MAHTSQFEITIKGKGGPIALHVLHADTVCPVFPGAQDHLTC